MGRQIIIKGWVAERLGESTICVDCKNSIEDRLILKKDSLSPKKVKITITTEFPEEEIGE